MPYSNLKDIALLLLRLVFGGLMLINHGWGKMMQLFTGDTLQFPDPLGIGNTISLALASFSEVLCAFLLIIGLFTRLASLPLIITMIVAVFVIHIDDPFSHWEMGLLYLTSYIAIGLSGPGWYSIDERFRKL
jgi:putative oxidoreductase